MITVSWIFGNKSTPFQSCVLHSLDLDLPLLQKEMHDTYNKIFAMQVLNNLSKQDKLCKIHNAFWVVVNNKLFQTRPSYFSLSLTIDVFYFQGIGQARLSMSRYAKIVSLTVYEQ